MAPVAVQLAKQAVLKSYELSLEEGLHFERRNFIFFLPPKTRRKG